MGLEDDVRRAVETRSQDKRATEDAISRSRQEFSETIAEFIRIARARRRPTIELVLMKERRPTIFNERAIAIAGTIQAWGPIQYEKGERTNGISVAISVDGQLMQIDGRVPERMPFGGSLYCMTVEGKPQNVNVSDGYMTSSFREDMVDYLARTQ